MELTSRANIAVWQWPRTMATLYNIKGKFFLGVSQGLTNPVRQVAAANKFFLRWHPTLLYGYYGIFCISHFGACNFEASLRILEKLYTPVVGNYYVLNYPFERHFSVSSPNRNNCSNTNYIETTHQSQPNSHCFQNLVHITRSARSGHIQITQYIYIYIYIYIHKILGKILAMESSIKRN